MNIKYKILATKIFERGLKKSVIAHSLGITPRALNNKIYGLTPFTWEQACRIHQKFFPDVGKDILFKTEDSDGKESATKEVV